MQDNETQSPSITKTDFILSRPELSAKELATAAAQEGIHFTEQYVRSTRSKATVKARQTAREKGGAVPTVAEGGGQNLEGMFAELALHIGLARAEKVLDQLRLLGREIGRHT